MFQRLICKGHSKHIIFENKWKKKNYGKLKLDVKLKETNDSAINISVSKPLCRVSNFNVFNVVLCQKEKIPRTSKQMKKSFKNFTTYFWRVRLTILSRTKNKPFAMSDVYIIFVFLFFFTRKYHVKTSWWLLP